jgi:hypothetical protein
MNDHAIVSFTISWLTETDDHAAFLKDHIDITNHDAQELLECNARAS